MSDLELKIRGRLIKAKGPGSRAINKLLEEKVMPVIMDTITEDVHAKAVEYASGISSPEQKVPRQATHPIGQSPSEYTSTGTLADSIKIISMSKTTKGVYRSIIAALVEYASWLEFGTGIFGPRGQPIVARGNAMKFEYQGKTIFAKMILGQPPQPFMRSSVWYLIDNFSQTKTKIEDKLKDVSI